jgi:general stress protein CsbA
MTIIAVIIMFVLSAVNYQQGYITTGDLFIITCILIVALQIERGILHKKEKKRHETTD